MFQISLDSGQVYDFQNHTHTKKKPDFYIIKNSGFYIYFKMQKI